MEWNKDYKPGIEDEQTGRKGWQVALLSDETLVYDPCPDCGADIINTSVTIQNQYERSETRGVLGDLSLEHAICNDCGTILYDWEYRYSEQPMRDKHTKYFDTQINEVQLPNGEWWELSVGDLWYDTEEEIELEFTDLPTDAVHFEITDESFGPELFRQVDIETEEFVEQVREGRLIPKAKLAGRNPSVTFEVEVGIDRMHFDEDNRYDLTEDEVVEMAKEILYSAPAFDSIKEYAIDHVLEVSDVDVGSIEPEGDHPDLEVTASGSHLTISYEDEAEHEFHFAVFDRSEYNDVDGDETVAWPEEMNQGGESYRIGVDDVPTFVEAKLEDLGYKLEEG